MPMDRRLYPKLWDAIAMAIKDAAGWQCQECGRPCRRTGEAWGDFVERLLRDGGADGWYRQTGEDWHDDESGEWGWIEKPGRFVLTVAHLNHKPEDCRAGNLKALCAPCHCRYDLRCMGTKKRLKLERAGQLTLPICQQPHPQGDGACKS